MNLKKNKSGYPVVYTALRSIFLRTIDYGRQKIMRSGLDLAKNFIQTKNFAIIVSRTINYKAVSRRCFIGSRLLDIIITVIIMFFIYFMIVTE